MVRARVLLVLLSLPGVCCPRCEAQSVPPALERAKRATAFVVGRSWAGTAFCIEPGGLFVTNAHVVEGAGGRVRLVLNSGEDDEAEFSAVVLRTDKEKDLALLQAGAGGPFASLPLGRVDGLYETVPLMALGFPYGEELATGRRRYPSVTVSTGKVTALRKQDGQIHRIQMDGSLNPGNSGGPVLDPAGRVIGVVVEGIEGAQIADLIPSTHVQQLLTQPDIFFDPAPVPRDQQYEPRQWEIRLVPHGARLAGLTLQLALSSGAGDERTLTATPIGEHRYTVTAAPLPTAADAVVLQITARGPGDPTTHHVRNKQVTVGERRIWLHQVRRLVGGEKPEITLTSGEKIAGAAQGLEALSLAPGGEARDVSGAESVVVRDTSVPVQSVAYRVYLIIGQQKVTLQSGQILVGKPEGFRADRKVPLPPIQETPLEDDVAERALPAVVDDVVAAGGGRYLVLRMTEARRVAIFDVNEGQVTRFLTIDSNDFSVAAGAEALIVVLHDRRVIERWCLETGERELTAPAPYEGTARGVAMGYASEGPLLLIVGGRPVVVDPVTLTLAQVEYNETLRVLASVDQNCSVRASADGSVFTVWNPSGAHSSITALTLCGGQCTPRARGAAAYALPGLDGSMLYTSGGPRDVAEAAAASNAFSEIACFPSLQGAYFIGAKIWERDVRVPVPEPANASPPTTPRPPSGARPRSGAGTPPKPTPPTPRRPTNFQRRRVLSIAAGVYTADRRPLMMLPPLDELLEAGDPRQEGRGLMALDRRVHFVERANLLVTVPGAQDRLVLRRLNVPRALNDAERDYLFVDSVPARSFAEGQTYAYQIGVQSRRGEVKHSLNNGPAGMTLSPEGLLEWKVPAKHANAEEKVVVTIRDASGQEIYHSFTIRQE